jgi:hypothetical protein
LKVTGPSNDADLTTARATSCESCGAALARAQRYCLECGERRGPLPPPVAERIDTFRRERRDAAATEEAEPTPTAGRRLPGRQAAAVAIMSMLGFGVLLGSPGSPAAESASLMRILVEAPAAAPAPQPGAVTASAPAPAATPPAPIPVAAPQPVVPAPTPTTPTAESAPKPSIPPEVPAPETLPAVKHVFLIVLADHGFQEGFGEKSPAPYLAKTLSGQGELLSNYYAVTQGDLANEIALVSGQGPNPETAANCPGYGEITPGTVGAGEQVEGSGCLYPPGALTLPGQLAAAGKRWKAYVEGVGNGEAGQPATCRRPATGGPDTNQQPLPGDAYETWRNPFVYFHSLLDGGECAANDVGLEQLGPDLEAKGSTPSLSYIVPNACHDGSEQPCEPGQPAGLTAAEPFLRTVVPEIEASPAYKEGGLIAIAFAQAPQAGPNADASACCATPAYPNLPPGPAPTSTNGPVKPSGGGGRVGLLLISPFVKPGSVDETGYYNHFSLLLSIEDLFGLKPLGYAAEPALSAFEGTVFNANP